MSMKRRVIAKGSWVTLVSLVNPDTNRKHFMIEISEWRLNLKDLTPVRRHFDPFGNRGSANGNRWKYRDRITAEQLMSVAIMKWGA